MKCKFIKIDSSVCSSNAMINSDYCYFHNPEITDEEKNNSQSKGGKNNLIKIQTPLPIIKIQEANDVLILLEDTINRVRSGELDVKIANCIGVLSGQAIKAIEISKLANKMEIIERAIFERKTTIS
ncbi:MAG: hypothetical protein UR28_C0028G0019 [Candidatus Peregrinibacteria bacterium GW2011_GWF2_33_10]|nr:MAG: hypothetical protein UR28_C0028G0019 [Candidatus Peregrinibacteria bacterium GW2011_GWF2_33_10]OGJ45855.1 MAG: hypothetical protein A2263_03625 [Candidatus Peregrinibacteria bacterium RIFOXYA2_FULL_33_21]OGJ51353.1 MAG: hypothetical protein A2307_02270 [Candidatus Peregrinibacteria bacterium RIFOXYB2_FULL_33_20]